VSKQVDANLVELARSWLSKLMPYRRADFVISSLDVCISGSIFLRYLLSYGCEIIGLNEEDEYLYLRCGSRLARLRLARLEIYTIKARCYEEFRDVVDPYKIPTISKDEVHELVDRKPYGGMSFWGTGVNISIFESEPVYLGALKGTPLYLEGVEVYSASSLGTPYLYSIKIMVGAESEEGGLRNIAIVSYGVVAVRDRIAREITLSGIEYSTRAEYQELSEKLLAILSEKSPIIDELIREVADMFIRGFKSIVIAVLY